MAVFRIERTKNYTVMSNYHLRDITIVSLHQNAQCGGPLHYGRAEIQRYVRQVPLYG